MTIKRQRFLPYAYGERRLGLEVRSVRAGVEAIDVDSIHDPSRRELDLRDHGQEREAIEIGVEVVGADQSLFASVLPAAEVTDPPVRFVVVVQDEGGWYRTVEPLERTEDGIRGTFALVPADSTGVLTVEAIGLRTSPASEPDPRFASGIGMRLANSHTLMIRTREPAPSPGGAIDVRWEDFATSKHSQRRRRPERIFYLETTAEPPILWLNHGVADLPVVLESKGTRGQRAVVRDLLNQAIALPVWYALVHVASLSVTQDEESRPTVPEGWRRGLLARIAPRFHPGVARETAYQRLLDELWAIRRDEDAGAAALIERMVTVIADEVNLADVARRALKELAR